ncbi:MAG: GNAT family protein [Cyanobacteria bacterium P01_D01_bin.56]
MTLVELKSERLIYRTLTLNDVTESYVSWLNDPDVNQYLEIRHISHNIENCRHFVETINLDDSQHLLGIFWFEDKNLGQLHIGNIKLGFINQYHLRGQLSLFIGEKRFWGKGLGTEAIRTVTQWGFDSLGLDKIEAGCYEDNLSSLRCFLKVGYQVEGFFRSHVVLNGQRKGSFWLGVLPHELI